MRTLPFFRAVARPRATAGSGPAITAALMMPSARAETRRSSLLLYPVRGQYLNLMVQMPRLRSEIFFDRKTF
jgi:hypothetical protein